LYRRFGYAHFNLFSLCDYAPLLIVEDSCCKSRVASLCTREPAHCAPSFAPEVLTGVTDRQGMKVCSRSCREGEILFLFAYREAAIAAVWLSPTREVPPEPSVATTD
jgi:hypothetical protein